MSETTYDLLVIGAGPGGYVAAIRAAQLGMSVACVDENASLGGTCLRVGCIPSKAMLDASEQYAMLQNGLADKGIDVGEVKLDLKTMLKHKESVTRTLTSGVDHLLKKNKVTRIQGRAGITEPGTVQVTGKDEGTYQAKRIIIATGSTPASLPGVDLKKSLVDTSTEALSYAKVPEKLAVIGAGYIGIELGSVWQRLGSEVTVIEYLDRILPGMDSDLASEALKEFRSQGMNFMLGSRVTGVKLQKGKKGVVIELDGADPVEASRVLVAVGRAPNTQGLGLEDLDVKLDDRGRILVDDNFKTNIDGIYAIGDVIPGPMLAHKAEEDGVACVEQIVNGTGHVDYSLVPGIVYTHPEIATVGKTEDQLKDDGHDYRVGNFPFIANGRARAMDDTGGRIKILADSKTDRVLGVHIIGPHAGDLIAECVAAMTFGASSEDIARVCHAHPTLSEAVKEAALAVDGRAIHY